VIILDKTKTFKIIIYSFLAIALICFFAYVSVPNFFDTSRTTISLEQNVNSLYIPYLEHGNCEIFLLQTGECIMLDCGSSEDFPLVFDKLRQLNITKIDNLILTSTEQETTGGLYKLLNNIQVKKVTVSSDAEKSERFAYSKKILETNGTDICYITSGSRLYERENIFIDVVNTEKYISDKEINAMSLYVCLNKNAVFFEGICDVKTEAKMASELKGFAKTDILVVSPSGLQPYISKYFMEEVNPQYAIISVHKDKYPTIGTLNSLKDVEVFRSDINGDISITFKNGNISFKTEQ